MSTVLEGPDEELFLLIFQTVNKEASFDKTLRPHPVFTEPESNMSAHSNQHTDRFSNSSETFCYLISYNEISSM